MARVKRLLGEVREHARLDPDYRPDNAYDLAVLVVVLLDLFLVIGRAL